MKPRPSVLELRCIRSEMEIHLTPELEARFDQLVSECGCAPEREMLYSRYDDLKSGRVRAVAGEAFFESLRQREF